LRFRRLRLKNRVYAPKGLHYGVSIRRGEDKVTQITEAKAGRITPEIRLVARDEDVSPEIVAEGIASGQINRDRQRTQNQSERQYRDVP
jgi:DNA-binding transcriptional regulator YdaS (Cro superfamily)